MYRQALMIKADCLLSITNWGIGNMEQAKMKRGKEVRE